MKAILIIFFLAVSLFTSSVVFADEIDTLKLSAENGNASAQYRLALAYATGSEVEKNRLESTRWMKLAAQNGNLYAQLHYGKYLPDYVEGFDWISKSANSDHFPAQVYLGEIYRTKNNPYIDVDIDKAIYWLKKAANSNHYDTLEASFRLFLMYESGDGVTMDEKEASKWLTFSMENTTFDADELFGYGGGDSSSFNHEYMYNRLAAEKGQPVAQNVLGNLYTRDFEAFNSPDVGQISVSRNGNKAVKWLTLAARNGSHHAYYDLGSIYEFGVFKKDPDIKEGETDGDWWEVNPNKIEAVKYYKWAARDNHYKAKERLEKLNTFESDHWNKYDMARTRYINHYLEYTWFDTSISYSRGGNKLIYFSIKEDKHLCKSEDYENGPKKAVWEIEDQAISMLLFCNKSNKNFNFINATPTTDKGVNFIVDTLEKANGNILINGSGYSFPVSTTGFTKAWNSKSNEVL